RPSRRAESGCNQWLRGNPDHWIVVTPGTAGLARARAATATAHGRQPAVGESAPMLPLFGALRWKKHLRAQYAVVALSVLLVAAHGASTAISLSSSYHRTLKRAAAALDSTAHLAAVGTAHSLSDVDMMLVVVERIVATAPTNAPLQAPELDTVM